MTLEKAIDMLKKEYELAKKQGYIRNPLAWALYQVWRAADRMKGENHETQKEIHRRISDAPDNRYNGEYL